MFCLSFYTDQSHTFCDGIKRSDFLFNLIVCLFSFANKLQNIILENKRKPISFIIRPLTLRKQKKTKYDL